MNPPLADAYNEEGQNQHQIRGGSPHENDQTRTQDARGQFAIYVLIF